MVSSTSGGTTEVERETEREGTRRETNRQTERWRETEAKRERGGGDVDERGNDILRLSMLRLELTLIYMYAFGHFTIVTAATSEYVCM